MIKHVRACLFAALAAGALAYGAPAAKAMPLDNSVSQSVDDATGVQKALWVCRYGRCWWRPGPRYWGPRPYWGRPYWRRPYWRRPYWRRRYW
jgi:hypothetical protein